MTAVQNVQARHCMALGMCNMLFLSVVVVVPSGALSLATKLSKDVVISRARFMHQRLSAGHVKTGESATLRCHAQLFNKAQHLCVVV